MKTNGLQVDTEKFVKQIINEKILNHTIQLFREINKEMKPYGSGVFCKIYDDYFIFTASHVADYLDDNDNHLYIRIEVKRWISLGGEIHRTEIEESAGLDLAYVKLQKDIGLILNKIYLCLETNKLSIHRHQYTNRTNYCILGYPEKNYKIQDGIIRTGSSYLVLPASDDKPYEYYKLPKEHFFITNLHGKVTDMFTGKKKKLDSRLNGISGCGLWYFDLIYDSNTQKIGIDYRLIGIVTDLNKSKYYCLVANKIHHIINALRVFEQYQFVEKDSKYVHEFYPKD